MTWYQGSAWDSEDEIAYEASTYRSQAARDAQSLSQSYADYIESHALELAERFPDRRDEFLTRSISEALEGNNGS